MSPAAPAKLTPMLRHYLEVKADHPDAIVFYRMGDFFELFYEDAQTAAPILEVTLTARQKGTPSEAPMCGVPHHALEGYVGKLLQRGFKVAICDQVEDPKEAKGLVKREVTRVMTPGTLSEPALLDGEEDNFLAALVTEEERVAGAFLDLSTGRFFLRRWTSAAEAEEELEVLRPREVIAPAGSLPETVKEWLHRRGVSHTVLDPEVQPDPRAAAQLLERQLEVGTLKGFGLETTEPVLRAAAMALLYAQEAQRSDLSHVRTLEVRDSAENLVLDPTTLANLEVLKTLREGKRRGSLLAVLDRTRTAAGGRLLRDWLRRPLRHRERIIERYDAVEALLTGTGLRNRVRELLDGFADLERLASRAVLGSLGPREADSLRDCLRRAPRLLAELESTPAPLLGALASRDPLPALLADLEKTLVEEPPASRKQGGVIAAGVDDELDHNRSLARDSKQHILALEAREREATGIGSLKIRYNKVFGYYLEVTKANQHLVPEHYIRKQTLVNAERYITPEVKELEEQVLGAEERQLALEDEHYAALLARISVQSTGLLALAATVAQIDVLASFAEVAARRRYTRPRLGPAGGAIAVSEGRHPVVEALTDEAFVPNDLELDAEGQQIIVLTGPNMGGKSTYLRQTALLVLMAQAGSFVPAEEAEIGLVDRIFTRVGASDDLARGESTFMVEMIETARILNYATEDSLVILDEVGRGTATFDGLSLAWAIVEHLQQHRRPKTLFATHYHELTELASMLPGVVNRTLAVKEWQDQIVFLRRVVPGSADKSYGIHVARLAGLPDSLVRRAREILANLEAQEYDPKGRPRLAQGSEAPPTAAAPQLQLFAPQDEVVAEVIRQLDIEELTPLAALNLLHSLQKRLG